MPRWRHCICAEVSNLYTASGGSAHRQLQSVSLGAAFASGCAHSCVPRGAVKAFLHLVTAPSVAQSLFLGPLHTGGPSIMARSGGENAQEWSPEVSGIPIIHRMRCVAWTDTSHMHNARNKNTSRPPPLHTSTTTTRRRVSRRLHQKKTLSVKRMVGGFKSSGLGRSCLDLQELFFSLVLATTRRSLVWPLLVELKRDAPDDSVPTCAAKNDSLPHVMFTSQSTTSWGVMLRKVWCRQLESWSHRVAQREDWQVRHEPRGGSCCARQEHAPGLWPSVLLMWTTHNPPAVLRAVGDLQQHFKFS